MSNKVLSSKRILEYLYLFGLMLMLAALPLSKYFMSVAQFVLGGTVLLEFYKASAFVSILKKRPLEARIVIALPLAIFLFIDAFVSIFRKFLRKDNLPAIILASIYVIHVAGLAFTSDYAYALKDLRIKLPILILPVIFSVSEPLKASRFYNLLLLFVAAVFAATLICTGVYLQGNIDDIRDISIFISHIRFSLLIALAFFILTYFIFRKGIYNKWWKAVFSSIAAWMLLYLLFTASFTGLAIIIITSVILLLYYVFKQKRKYVNAGIIGFLVILVLSIFFYIRGIYFDVNTVKSIDIENIDQNSALGSIYWHDFSNKETENGYYVWLYIANNELKEAWNERSSFDYSGKDKKGQLLKFTLIRYMTSKGLRKDAAGVAQLTEEDIQNVENGIASIVYVNKPVPYVRIYKTLWALNRYNETGNASGNSLLQRIEYWKASIGIIKHNWKFGVGTGDLPNAFEDQYNRMNTSLEDKFQWRSHNQFLAIFVGFGIFGLLWFIFALIYPGWKLRKFDDYLYSVFFTIIVLSMFTEDTIETQAGATIFAFFSSLLLFGRSEKKEEKKE